MRPYLCEVTVSHLHRSSAGCADEPVPYWYAGLGLAELALTVHPTQQEV